METNFHSSFPKVASVDIFVLLLFENSLVFSYQSNNILMQCTVKI